MALTLPTSPKPAAVMFDLENVSRSGGVSTNGQEQVVGSGVGRWVATLSGLVIRNNAQVLAWRAWKAAMRGKAGTVLVPVYDGKRANWPVDQYGRMLKPKFTRRRELDGTVYEDPEIPAESAVTATVTAAADRRATTLLITVAQGTTPRAGQYFSIGNRLYLITDIIGTGTYGIEPPLREAVTAGAAVNFTRPVCEMRLASDDGGRIDLSLLMFANLSIDFVEAV